MINGYIPNPCTKDCPDRCVGCAITCEKWADYISIRDEEYARRKNIVVNSPYTIKTEDRHRSYLKKKLNLRVHYK